MRNDRDGKSLVRDSYEEGYLIGRKHSSLEERRHRFIFDKDPDFAPAQRSDIVGIDPILREVDPYITYLRHYAQFVEVGARPSPGVCFYGEPGTGKTLVARYIATASDARVIPARNFPTHDPVYTKNDIIALFRLCREYVKKRRQPIVVFWDEFETVGRERENLSGTLADTVSQLTAELDGFNGKNHGILIVATTNYFDDIDDALARPGRIGHHIEFFPPDVEGKQALLRHYVEKKPHKKIDYRSISFLFHENDSPARIEEKVEQAYFLGVEQRVRDGKPTNLKLTDKALVKVLIENLLGIPRSIYLTEEERLSCAVHELGHAVTARYYGFPVQVVSVVAAGYGQGKTVMIRESSTIETVDELYGRITATFGGVIAEEMCCIPRNGGSCSDFYIATKNAVNLVERLGAGRTVGLLSMDGLFAGRKTRARAETHPQFSVALLQSSERDCNTILKECYRRAERILHPIGAPRIRRMARTVVEQEFLVQRQLDELIGMHVPAKLRGQAMVTEK